MKEVLKCDLCSNPVGTFEPRYHIDDRSFLVCCDCFLVIENKIDKSFDRTLRRIFKDVPKIVI